MSRKTLEKWRRQMEPRRESDPATAAVAGETLEEENRRLKRALGEKVLDVDFLQGALRNIEDRRRQNIVCFRQVCVVEDTWFNSWGLCRGDERVKQSG